MSGPIPPAADYAGKPLPEVQIITNRLLSADTTEKVLNAFVLITGPAKYQSYFHIDGRFTKTFFDFFNGKIAFAEIFFHKVVVLFRSRFNQHGTIFFNFRLVIPQKPENTLKLMHIIILLVSD